MAFADVAWWSNVAQLVGLPLAVAAIGLAVLQVRKQAQDSLVSSLLALDEAFAHHTKTRAKLNDPRWNPNPNDMSVDDRNELRRYMAVFERLGILVTKGSLDVRTASTFYGDRFEKLVRRRVVSWILERRTEEWHFFVYLWRRLEAERPGIQPLPESLRRHRLAWQARRWVPTVLQRSS